MRIWALVLAFFCSPVMAFSLFGPNVDPVKDRLDDPYSAKFENVHTVANGAVCGQFNAKNAFGAYVGRRLFAIVDGKAYMQGAPADENAVVAYCVTGKDCKDKKCANAILADMNERDEQKALVPLVAQLRENTPALCAIYLETDKKRAHKCGDMYYECTRLKEIKSEARCYGAIVSEFKK